MKEKHVPVVFVVDDEAVIAQSLATILERNGYAARFFTDPLEALANVQIDRPDLLISDVAMPQLSGIDLAIAVKTRCSDCKILLISGQACTHDILREPSVRAHHFTVLPKPYTLRICFERFTKFKTPSCESPTATDPDPTREFRDPNVLRKSKFLTQPNAVIIRVELIPARPCRRPKLDSRLLSSGHSGEETFFELTLPDLTRAADLFAPVHERTSGNDGFVSLEVKQSEVVWPSTSRFFFLDSTTWRRQRRICGGSSGVLQRASVPLFVR